MARVDTVYDRLKQTGYLTGPRHRMFGGSPGGDDETAEGEAGASEDNAEEEAGEEGQPPNLRDADGPESCGDCVHFNLSAPAAAGSEEGGPAPGGAGGGAAGSGNCSLYDYSVTPNEVCDSFEPAETGLSTPGMPGTAEESPA